MTDRISLNDMTSDQLDALYARLESARNAATLHRQGLISIAELYAAIEADAEPASGCVAHDGPCFPDLTAKCPAHGEQQCAHCHRNPGNCTDDYGGCGFWSSTGMHWDTCPNRIRGPLTPKEQP